MIPLITNLFLDDFGNHIEELWVDVIEFEGLYMVSNYGRLKRLERIDALTSCYIPEKLIRDVIRKHHCYWSLCKNGKYKIWASHRLVALHFVDGYDPNLVVNHLDGDPKNNFYKNLEWTTPLGNARHARITGLIRQNGQDSVLSKLTNSEALEIFKSNLMQKDLAKKYRVSKQTICNIKNKLTYKNIHARVASR